MEAKLQQVETKPNAVSEATQPAAETAAPQQVKPVQQQSAKLEEKPKQQAVKLQQVETRSQTPTEEPGDQ